MDSATDRPATANSKRHITPKASFDRPPTARTSLSTEEVYPSVSTALRFADFVTGLNDASAEIRALVTVLQRVGEDISLALRLRNSSHVQECCQSQPDERIWIDNVLVDVQSAINDIGVFVENVRVSGDEGGEVKLKQKFNWVLSHHHKVRDRQATLLICHQSLSTAINFMQMIKMGEFPQELQGDEHMSVIHEAPLRPWMQEEDNYLLRGPYMRHKHRLSQRNLSLPSILVSEHEDKKEEVSTAVFEPVELPGSTPEDIPDPDNLDLYSLPPKPQTTVHQSVSPPPPVITNGVDNASESDASPKSPKHADTVPLLAKRYRARRVLVPAASPGRHRSLPVQLPYIPQTPSLASDLSDFLSDLGNDNALAMMESPVSDASSPQAPPSAASGPDRRTSFESATNAASATATSNRVAASPKQNQISPIVSQETSLEPPPGRNSIESSITVAASEGPISPPVDAADQGAHTGAQAEVTSQASPVELPAQKEALSEEPPPAPADPIIPTEMKTQTLTLHPKPTPTIAVPPAPVEEPTSGGHVESEPNESQAKPMTSQAKRRAAHARRMRAVYG